MVGGGVARGVLKAEVSSKKADPVRLPVALSCASVVLLFKLGVPVSLPPPLVSFPAASVVLLVMLGAGSVSVSSGEAAVLVASGVVLVFWVCTSVQCVAEVLHGEVCAVVVLAKDAKVSVYSAVLEV